MKEELIEVAKELPLKQTFIAAMIFDLLVIIAMIITLQIGENDEKNTKKRKGTNHHKKFPLSK